MSEGSEVARLIHLIDHFARAGDIALCAEARQKLEHDYGIRIVGSEVPDSPARYERAINPKVPAKRSRRSN